VDGRRPYQNGSITSVISVFYLTRSTDIIDANRGRFAPTAEGYTANELPDSMIASAATAVSATSCPLSPFAHVSSQVYAALSAWRTGRHQSTDFSANSFASVYAAHITLLACIERDNPRGYHLLKAKLFEEVT
jgi:hypothetical protein